MVQSATTPWDVAAASVVGDSTLSSWYVDGSLLRLGGIPDIPLCLLVCGSSGSCLARAVLDSGISALPWLEWGCQMEVPLIIPGDVAADVLSALLDVSWRGSEALAVAACPRFGAYRRGWLEGEIVVLVASSVKIWPEKMKTTGVPWICLDVIFVLSRDLDVSQGCTVLSN